MDADNIATNLGFKLSDISFKDTISNWILVKKTSGGWGVQGFTEKGMIRTSKIKVLDLENGYVKTSNSFYKLLGEGV